MKKNLAVIIGIIFSVAGLHSQVVINEVSSVNYDVLMDEDHERPDWIELYNTSPNPVNLGGWKIFDRDNINNAWTFPNYEMAGYERFVVMASGKNYSNSGKFIMEAAGQGIFPHSRDDSYKFQYTELSGDFEFSVQVHSISNIAPFGSTGVIVREDLTNTNRFFGVFSQRDDRPNCEFLYRDTTVFEYRYPKRIYSKTEAIYPNVVLSVKRKDDSITAGIYDIEGFCLESHTMFWDFPHNVFVGIALSSTNPGNNGKASYSNLKVNGSAYGFESLNTIEHDLMLSGKSYFSREMHTNFSISRSGETVYLWNRQGNLVDKVELPEMYVDMSYARIPNGTGNWTYSMPPTPEKINENPKLGIVKNPQFSQEAGMYESPISVSIKLDNSAEVCFYTLDGSEPNETSTKYQGGTIFINNTTVLKAIAYRNNYIPSQIETATYLINENTAGMPVVSISSNPEYFFDEEIGLFERPHSNFEYPLTFEFFEFNDKRDFVNRTAIKTHGHGAALDEQTSLRFNAKSKYGLSDLEYPFFGESGLKVYDKILIRNSGQDRFGAFIRDAFVSVLGEKIDFVKGTAYRPVMVYLNGEFWGMYNLRERFDTELIEGRHKVEVPSISMMEPVYRLMAGSSRTYRDMLITMREIDADSVISYLDNIIDIDNLIDYSAVSFWANNTDWPQHNFKFWRSSQLDNKWRWILMDFDLSLNFDFTNIFRVDHFKYSMEKAQEDPELYHFPSILLNSFKSKEFRDKYLNRNCDLLNTTLSAEPLQNLLDSLITNIRPTVPIQINRWERSIPLFDKHVDMMMTYFEERPSYYREHLREYFELSGTVVIEVTSNLPNACTFNVNSLNKLPIGWNGIYFREIPIKVTYNRNIGSEFKFWFINESMIVLGDTLSFTPYDSIASIKAIFEEIFEPVPGMVVINEIMYKAAPDINSDDWVELYNPGDLDIDVSGWLMKDDNNNRHFAIPNNTTLKSGEYLVLIESRNRFTRIYPQIKNFTGEFSFGLGTDDMVRIFDNHGVLKDSVKYTNRPPWYPEADGLGPSLELIDAFSDNSIASSWRVSYVDGGTPGRPNSATSISDNFYENHLKVYPNPVRVQANIDFTVDKGENISLEIYDLFGNKIRNLIDGFYDAGFYSTFWDSKDEKGKLMPSGMYFIKIQSGNSSKIEKIILE
ncbi:MAG: lamin tail domain-containing protein [Candidatus Kapabacteria bacterium]|nr:lamin tail domain-containing protein [Ignavibacteriota bacterium]MCW5885520.1 lamin tail domain-containing protein [Candidatus Kapabacteria bacterium]